MHHFKLLQHLLDVYHLGRCSIFSNCLRFQTTTTSVLECSDSSAFEIADSDLKIIEDFISVVDENALLKDIEPKWRRLKYQEAHWDNVRRLIQNEYH